APKTRSGERTLLVLDVPALDRFRRGEGEYRARPVAGWDALEAELAAAPPSTVALVDPYAERRRGEPPSPRLRTLLWRRPGAPVVAALALRPERVGDVKLLLEWGVSEVVDLELETTPAALLVRLRGAHARP